MTWQQFLLEHGRGVPDPWLATVCDVPVEEIRQFKDKNRIPRRSHLRTYPELFAAFRGRPPADDEWPAPSRRGGGYAWYAPELKLLATFTGQMAPAEIARALTARLRELTGDPRAARSIDALNVGRQRLGIQSGDLVGGLSVRAAAREIGYSSILYNDIRTGKLQARRIGRYLVIPHEAFAAWKAKRVFPPKGFVQLTTLKRPLGIKSDKLSEWARAGKIPTAIRCNPYGTRAHSTQFGTWFIDRRIVKQLIADRRAGRPMPWHGTGDLGNLQVTWRLWQQRQHPARCESCRTIWGADGPPATFDDYVRRYPPLAHGAKRHLTRVWSDGLTVEEVARHCGVTSSHVASAIQGGALRSHLVGRTRYITRTDATRWKARRCPTGSGTHSWMSIAAAAKYYGFGQQELLGLVQLRLLAHKVGASGAQRNVTYVQKHQMRLLREEIGFSVADVARRYRISEARVRELAERLDWRAGDRLTLDVVTGIGKRLESAEGYTIAQAAEQLGQSVAWVERAIANGVARVSRTPRSTRRYLSAPQFRRLHAAASAPTPEPPKLTKGLWLLSSDAALLAGVSAAMIVRWANAGEVKFRMAGAYRRYHRGSVIQRARRYWRQEVRFKRAVPPDWLRHDDQEAA
jgi:excisionase family DNA binding protein